MMCGLCNPDAYGTVEMRMGSDTHEMRELKFMERLNREGVTESTLELFRDAILAYYLEHGRRLPWRETHNPYRILVSEIMLQQTQVPRVLDKYREFLATFPDIKALAEASLKDVLEIWQGLGYNRRAVSLKRAAEVLVERFGGKLPEDPDELKKLPGIGPATAAALSAFAFNRASPFIETNIRAVYIHFFFHDRHDVRDSELMPLIEKTLDRNDPRNWYYALMDYGNMLKKTRSNPSRKSAHHKVQSPFKGSNRALRAEALRVVLRRGRVGVHDIATALDVSDERARKLLDELERDGFIARHDEWYGIK